MTDLSQWATWRELHAQPDIWRDWADRLDVDAWRQWIGTPEEVWFCGAGTSAYIGDIIVAGLEGAAGPRLRSVPSTDLVSRPQAYLSGRSPLIVNFGRSGSSSESVGTLEAVAALAPGARQLHITCNPDGALAQSETANAKVILLPETTHDTGFAMTSSFSTMLLTALALFDPVPDAAQRLRDLSDTLERTLPSFTPGPAPERIVFTGTGPLAYAAREAALKVMELTSGRIPALWDSTLGFRHGPKSFVQPGTQIVVLTSPEAGPRQYEDDLAQELRAQFPKSSVHTLGARADIDISMKHGASWGSVLPVVWAQVAAVVWSDAMGLNVDDPFAGAGTLARVVSGVTLYPVTP